MQTGEISRTAQKRLDALRKKAAKNSLKEALSPDAKAIRDRVEAEQIPEAELKRGTQQQKK